MIKVNFFVFCLPVVVSEFDVPPGLQNLPVLQPGELRLRLTPRLTGEDSGGADGAGDGLWRLNEFCWSCKRRQTENQIE